MEKQDNINKELIEELRLLRREIAESTRRSDEKIAEEFRMLRVKMNESIAKIGSRLINSLKMPLNWDDLPSELKALCIDKLGVRDRFQLWNTSKAERALVNSQKLKFEKLEINITTWDTFIDLYHPNEFFSTFHQFPRKDNEIIPKMFIEFLMKIGNFEEFSIDFKKKIFCGAYPGFPGPYPIEPENARNDTIFCLEKLNKNGKKITLNMNNIYGKISIEKLLLIPSIMTTQLFQIIDLWDDDVVQKVAKMFINRDAEIGTTFQAVATMSAPFSTFLHEVLTEYFDFSVVSKDEKLIRLRTENRKKHILMELSLEGEHDWEPTEYFRIQVISAKMKKSEYEVDAKSWKKVLTPDKFSDDEENYGGDYEDYDWSDDESVNIDE